MTSHAPDRKASATAGTLEVHLCAGLGNRLLALLCALAVADLAGARLRLTWDKAPNICPCAFEDLFEPITSFDVEWMDPSGESKDLDVLREFDKATWDRLCGGGLVRCRWFALPAHPTLPTSVFFPCFRHHAERLRPSAAVRALMAPVNPRRIGVHMRGTDHLPALTFTPFWCYRSALEHIAKEHSDSEVLLCSDDVSRAASAVSGLKLRLVPSPSQVLEQDVIRSSVHGMQAAFAELSMLAQCRAVISSPYSTFAQTAVITTGIPWLMIDAFPGSTRAKVRTLMWAINHHVRYQRPLGPFRPSPDVHAIPAFLAAQFAGLVVSPLWQNHARARTRAGFERDLADRLAALPPG